MLFLVIINMKRSSSGKKQKQLTLGAFNFTKTVKHRNQEVSVEIPKVARMEINRIKCPKCVKTFVNNQGLSVHLKCVHNSSLEIENMATALIKFKETVKEPIDPVLVETRSLLNEVVNKVVGKVSKAEAAKHQAGKKRHQYSAVFKAEVIDQMEQPGSTQESVAEHFRIDQSQVSRYVKNKIEIMRDAADEYRKKLLKGRKCEKYKDVYPALWENFKAARARGHRVDFHWLWSKGRVIHRRLTGDESSQLGHHVITRFLHDYKIRMRTKQRGKKKSKEAMVEPLKKWHATYRERCIRPVKPGYDPKWGGFLPPLRLNVDQSPLPFVVNSTRTYEYVEKKDKNHNTWISQPGSGLDKRQCSLQILFRPEGKQPKLGIVFRGKGFISMDEKLAYHQSVDVFFQPNAWVDIHVCKKWIDTTLRPFVKDEKLGNFLLLLDNLTCQVSDEFKEEIASMKGLCWYGLNQGTDL